jgi:hypothetical protein
MIIRALLYPEVPEKGMTDRQKLVNLNVRQHLNLNNDKNNDTIISCSQELEDIRESGNIWQEIRMENRF